jgi:REP element-mobilizing transposase RayT
MPLSNEIPNKCLECRKYSRPTIHSKCTICKDLGLQEGLLCDLNRQVQDLHDFSCYAFTPSLKLVKSSTQEDVKLPNDSTDSFSNTSLQQILGSDKLKYQRALAAQRLGNDPETICMDIKYHLAWNVIHRKTFFSNPTESFELVSEVFLNCSEVFNSFVNLLWLAPDHVHIYVESDGEKSIDTLAQELKKISASSIAAKDLGLMTSSDASFNLWDKAYFVETIG